jgi:hypothetical protein
MFVFT